jgi:hypothetical protein
MRLELQHLVPSRRSVASRRPSWLWLALSLGCRHCGRETECLFKSLIGIKTERRTGFALHKHAGIGSYSQAEAVRRTCIGCLICSSLQRVGTHDKAGEDASEFADHWLLILWPASLIALRV